MGILEWLFGAKPVSVRGGGRVHAVAPRGRYDVEVVGESHHVTAFRRICGAPDGRTIEVTAFLVREPRNRHDVNAVAIVVNRRKLGYLGREDALRFRDLIDRTNAEGSAVACKAEIKAGWEGSEAYAGPYCIRLDLAPPPQEAFEKWSRKLQALRTPVARRRALEEGLADIADDALREQLRIQAATLEVDHVLAKVASLKSAPARAKQLDEATARLEASDLPEDAREECLRRLRKGVE